MENMARKRMKLNLLIKKVRRRNEKTLEAEKDQCLRRRTRRGDDSNVLICDQTGRNDFKVNLFGWERTDDARAKEEKMKLVQLRTFSTKKKKNIVWRFSKHFNVTRGNVGISWFWSFHLFVQVFEKKKIFSNLSKRKMKTQIWSVDFEEDRWNDFQLDKRWN